MKKRLMKALAMLTALTAAAALALPMAVSAKTAPKEDFSKELIILHTNDSHGHDITEKGVSLGSAGVKAIKEYYEEKGADVLLLNAGDVIQGTVLSTITQGNSAVDFANEVGYTMMTVGNHEFDYAVAHGRSLLEKTNFPVLSANILYKDSGKNVFHANMMTVTPKGYKVGIFGLTTPATISVSMPSHVKDFKFLAERELYDCAQAQIDYLKSHGCDLIICVGHLGIDDSDAPNRSIDVINNTTGIDLFIDGHSHTEIPNGMKVGDSLLASAGCYLANLGKVVYDGKSMTASLISAADYNGPYDPDLMALDYAYEAYVEENTSQVFAKTSVVLNGTKEGGEIKDANGNVITAVPVGSRTGETNYGDLAADAQLYAVRKEGVQADFSIINGGNVRASILPGDITKKHLINTFPFSNTLCTVPLTGSQVLEMLEASCSACPGAIGAFPQVAGISFTINTGIPYEKGAAYEGTTFFAPASPGKRITDVKIGGEPLDLNKTYILVANDFLMDGGDTYAVLKAPYQKSGKDLGIALESAVIDYISDQLGGVVGDSYKEPQGRIVIK